MERRFLLTTMLNPGVKSFMGFGKKYLCDETKTGKPRINQDSKGFHRRGRGGET